jgi:very-short-patch-repair endonuclease
MGEPFIGSEVVAAGKLSPYTLRTRFVAVAPDIYLPRNTELDAYIRAKVAWLWSRRQGVLAGRSAAAMHGAQWVDNNAPAQIIYPNRHRPKGIETWSDRIAADEVVVVDGIAVTTPERTALDIGCRNRLTAAVASVDALTAATRLAITDVEALAMRYPGRRGIKNARRALSLTDSGAESPRESWLRMLIERNNFPRPQTQILVYDEYGQIIARLDMGWDELKIAVEYDGDHHRTDRRQFNRDIRKYDDLTELGWIAIRVTAQDTEATIVRRIAAAFARRMVRV